jgi:hypothetical protein
MQIFALKMHQRFDGDGGFCNVNAGMMLSWNWLLLD